MRLAVVIGFGPSSVVSGFTLAGEIGIGAPGWQGCASGTGDRVVARGLATFASGAVAAGTVVADGVLAGNRDASRNCGDGGVAPSLRAELLRWFNGPAGFA